MQRHELNANTGNRKGFWTPKNIFSDSHNLIFKPEHQVCSCRNISVARAPLTCKRAGSCAAARRGRASGCRRAAWRSPPRCSPPASCATPSLSPYKTPASRIHLYGLHLSCARRSESVTSCRVRIVQHGLGSNWLFLLKCRSNSAQDVETHCVCV